MIKERQKKWGMIALAALLVLVLLPEHAATWMIANETPIGFVWIGPQELNPDVVAGAAYFLKSYAHVLRVLAVVETTTVREMPRKRAQRGLSRALFLLGKAQRSYGRLVAKTAKGRMKPEVFLMLRSIDYEGLARDKGVGDTVISRIRSQLGDGNLYEIYRHLESRAADIADQLHTLLTVLRSGDSPCIDLIWRLNRSYADTLIYGQTVSEIFCHIAGKQVVDGLK